MLNALTDHTYQSHANTLLGIWNSYCSYSAKCWGGNSDVFDIFQLVKIYCQKFNLQKGLTAFTIAWWKTLADLPSKFFPKNVHMSKFSCIKLLHFTAKYSSKFWLRGDFGGWWHFQCLTDKILMSGQCLKQLMDQHTIVQNGVFVMLQPLAIAASIVLVFNLA